jgi:hypothetical protein
MAECLRNGDPRRHPIDARPHFPEGNQVVFGAPCQDAAKLFTYRCCIGDLRDMSVRGPCVGGRHRCGSRASGSSRYLLGVAHRAGSSYEPTPLFRRTRHRD